MHTPVVLNGRQRDAKPLHQKLFRREKEENGKEEERGKTAPGCRSVLIIREPPGCAIPGISRNRRTGGPARPDVSCRSPAKIAPDPLPWLITFRRFASKGVDACSPLPQGNRLYYPYDPISNYVATIASDPEIKSPIWLASSTTRPSTFFPLSSSLWTRQGNFRSHCFD